MSHALPREWFGSSIRNDGLKREKARVRTGSVTLYLAAIALPLMAFLFYFYQGNQVITVGYEIDRLRQEHQALQIERDRFEVELASLKNLAVVEKLAAEDLGMVFPSLGQVVHVKEIPSEKAALAVSLGKKRGASLSGERLAGPTAQYYRNVTDLTMKEIWKKGSIDR